MPVIVCSFMPGKRLNLGPLDRRLISWALRLLVRSVTRLGLFVVTLSEELVLLVSVLSELFSGSLVVSGTLKCVSSRRSCHCLGVLLLAFHTFLLYIYI